MPLAIEMDCCGGPDVLHPVERRDAIPREDEVVVRTVAAGVNRADLFIRSGEWSIAGAFPYVPGLEVSGVVERIGSAVRAFTVGDPVITMMQRLGGIHGTRPGGYQTHVLVPESTLVRIPDALTPLDAARLGLPAVTAELALEVLDLRPGQRVLVHGGSSAVGSLAIQIATASQCIVVATGTRPNKFDFMRECGAINVVDTREATWFERVGRVDRVFDLIGEATFAKSVAALAAEGRLVFVGGTSGANLSLSGWDLMKPVALVGYSTETLTRPTLAKAMGLLEARWTKGQLRPRVAEFPLSEAATAHRAMEGGAAAGRVLLRP